MSSQEEQQFDKATKEILVKLVTALLCDKPKDPVSITNQNIIPLYILNNNCISRFHMCIHICWI